MSNAAELREMSDEQLELTRKETGGKPVPVADSSSDRTAGRTQRTAAAAPAVGEDQHDTDGAAN